MVNTEQLNTKQAAGPRDPQFTSHKQITSFHLSLLVFKVEDKNYVPLIGLLRKSIEVKFAKHFAPKRKKDKLEQPVALAMPSTRHS